MPSRMVINKESTIGDNNKLKRATPSIKVGVNPNVNAAVKPVGMKHSLGTSKVVLRHVKHEERAPAEPPSPGPAKGLK